MTHKTPKDYYHENDLTDDERVAMMRAIKRDAFYQNIGPFLGPFFFAMFFLIVGVVIARLVL